MIFKSPLSHDNDPVIEPKYCKFKLSCNKPKLGFYNDINSRPCFLHFVNLVSCLRFGVTDFYWLFVSPSRSNARAILL